MPCGCGGLRAVCVHDDLLVAMTESGSGRRFIRRWKTSEYATDRRGFEASFLETVSRLVPELVSSLRLDVLPVFEALEALADQAADPIVADGLRREFEVAGEPSPVIGVLHGSNVRFSERPFRLTIRWSALRVADESDRVYPDFLPLRIAVERWAEKFNMVGSGFFLNSAIATLRQWSEFPQFIDIDNECLVLRGRGGFSPVSGEESRFSFENSGWDPAYERFSSFEARLRKQFDSELSAYRGRLEELAEERGHLRIPDFHRTEHIEWLALFQCGGQSLAKIKETWAQDTTTISKGIKNAAELVGITLRTNGRGRPRKLNS